MRPWLLWVGFAILPLAASPGEPPAPAGRPLVGAIRWDAWHRVPADGIAWPVRAMERSLAPARYHHRLPFFATAVADGEVRVNGYTAEIVDREIAFAKAGGLDYWAFLLYATNDPMSQALSLYLASPRRADVRFCAIAGTATLEREPSRLVELMGQACHVKVAGGRPLLFAFRVTDASVRAWGGPEKARARFDALRAAAVAAGCGDPYLVAMNDSAAEGRRIAGVIGADAIGDYAVAGNGGTNGTPYAELARTARRFWEEAARAGAALVPLAMAGWDRRPRVEQPVPWETWQKPGDGLDRYYASPTPAELAAHVREASDWVGAHPERCPARAVLIYAWNEHDEGGWLCPTLGADGRPDTSRLDALAALRAPDAGAPVVQPLEERNAGVSNAWK